MTLKKLLVLFTILAPTVFFATCSSNLLTKPQSVESVPAQSGQQLPQTTTYTLHFSDNISCRTKDGNELQSGKDTVKIGEKLSLKVKSSTSALPDNWEVSAWGVWKKDSQNHDAAESFAKKNNNSGEHTYTVDAEHSCSGKIEITYFVKSKKEPTEVKSLNTTLKGLTIDSGIPHEFFFFDIHKNEHLWAERLYNFIDQKKKDLNCPENDYNLPKETIGKNEANIDLSHFKKESDFQMLFYAQKSKTDPVHYELKNIDKVKKTETDIFTFDWDANKNNLVVKKDSSYTFDKEPDGRLYVLQGNKIYLMGIDGLSESEIEKLEGSSETEKVITDIFAKSISDGGLKEAFELKDDDTFDAKKKKTQYVHDYLVDTVTYAHSPYCRSAYGALVKKECVCGGYASAFAKLMNKLNVDTKYITGDAGGPHAWNVVNLGNKDTPKWYHVDVTWDDQKNPSAYAEQGIKDARYMFFLKSTGYMQKHSHTYSPNYQYTCDYPEYDDPKQDNFEWTRKKQ